MSAPAIHCAIVWAWTVVAAIRCAVATRSVPKTRPVPVWDTPAPALDIPVAAMAIVPAIQSVWYAGIIACVCGIILPVTAIGCVWGIDIIKPGTNGGIDKV